MTDPVWLKDRREEVLLILYENSGGNLQVFFDVEEQATELGYKEEEMEAIINSLEVHGLIRVTGRAVNEAPTVFYLTRKGIIKAERIDDTNYELDEARAGDVSTSEASTLSASHPNPSNVFVVYGRNEALRGGLFSFLRALRLNPLEWSDAIRLTGKGSPFIGEILDAAFANARVVVALLTPDDEAKLKDELLRQEDDEYEKTLTGQARPNVLFEAGMAFGRYPNQTILVGIGKLRPFSDVAGRHIIWLDNSPEKRNELAQRLETAGCSVSRVANDWLKVGDFTAQSESEEEDRPQEPLEWATPTSGTETEASRGAIFQKLVEMMPDLLAEMRDGLSNPDYMLIRKFIPIEAKAYENALGLPKDHFVYYGDVHLRLREKVDLLEEFKFVVSVHTGQSWRSYRLTDEFVHALINWEMSPKPS